MGQAEFSCRDMSVSSASSYSAFVSVDLIKDIPDHLKSAHCCIEVRPVGPGVPGVPWHPQILKYQLTLYQPERADYAHHINTGTPGFSDLPTALVLTYQLIWKYECVMVLKVAQSQKVFHLIA